MRKCLGDFIGFRVGPLLLLSIISHKGRPQGVGHARAGDHAAQRAALARSIASQTASISPGCPFCYRARSSAVECIRRRRCFARPVKLLGGVLALICLPEQSAVRVVAAGHAHRHFEKVDLGAVGRVHRDKLELVLRAQVDRHQPAIDRDLGAATQSAQSVRPCASAAPRGRTRCSCRDTARSCASCSAAPGQTAPRAC